MSTFLSRIMAWMSSHEGQVRTEYARILLPLAIFAVILLWLVGRVLGAIDTVALSL